MPSKTITLALTGGFGTGKSTAAKIFKDLGACVVDCDAIARELTQKGATKILRKIHHHFGDKVFDDQGNLNRHALAAIVFKNRQKRKVLEKILHPMILEKVLETLSSGNKPIRVVEIPLFFEVGDTNGKWGKIFDASLVVFASKDKTLRRLAAKGIPRKEFLNRIGNQWPIEVKCKRADFVVDNNKSRQWLKKQIHVLYRACTLVLKIIHRRREQKHDDE